MISANLPHFGRHAARQNYILYNRLKPLLCGQSFWHAEKGMARCGGVNVHISADLNASCVTVRDDLLDLKHPREVCGLSLVEEKSRKTRIAS